MTDGRGVFLFLATILMLASSCSTPSGVEPPEDEIVANGRAIVANNCASCHAIDRESKSPNPEAPPMKGLLSRYDREMLTEDLIEGVRVGHDEMPRFDFDVRAADAVVAYLRSIESH